MACELSLCIPQGSMMREAACDACLPLDLLSSCFLSLGSKCSKFDCKTGLSPL